MSLHDLFVAQITENGPMRISDFMSDCLLHPQFGYYTNQDPFGASGDFITAPEISQMFGELIGLSLAQAWLDQGAPSSFALLELGPGRGTLMADILRATKALPKFGEAAQVYLLEASEKLRKVQDQTLAEHDVKWIDTLDQLPDIPVLAVANEFFDALPIRQFLRDGDSWRERQVGPIVWKIRKTAIWLKTALLPRRSFMGLDNISKHMAVQHSLSITAIGAVWAIRFRRSKITNPLIP